MKFTKFIIVSGQRTGSTLLESLLASHDEIICQGELLNSGDEIRRNAAGPDVPLLGEDDDAVVHLQNTLYAQVPESVRAVGFRLHYDHARQGAWKEVRDAIVNDNDVRIIHLTRKNLLDRYLSYRLAIRDDRWIAMNEVPPSQDEMIILDVKDCVEDFVRSEWFQDEADRIFSAHPKFDLTYEGLCADTDSEMGRVLQFLGVEFQQLHSPTKRQRKRTKRKVIQNFDELKIWFSHGIEKGWSKPHWLDYFDES